MKQQLLVVIMIGLCAPLASIKLPSYIRPCDYNDPDLEGCALREGRRTMKLVVNGDRKYNIPNMEPLIINELKVDQDSEGQAIGFSFVAYNCTVWGIPDTQLKAVRFDRKNRRNEYDVEIPRLEIRSKYNAKGRVLLLPITGAGAANITITNMKATYRYNYTVDRRDDGNFLNITDNKLDFKIDGRLYIHLDNLLNGEKIFEDNINAVLNDNWQDLVKDVGPTISVAIGNLMKIVLGGIFNSVSLQDAFLNYPRAA